MISDLIKTKGILFGGFIGLLLLLPFAAMNGMAIGATFGGGLGAEIVGIILQHLSREQKSVPVENIGAFLGMIIGFLIVFIIHLLIGFIIGGILGLSIQKILKHF